MNLIKYLVFGVIFFATSFSFAATLEVGTIERPPFSFKNESGEWSGFSVEIFTEIAEKNNIDFNFKEFEIFSEMIGSVDESKVDLAAANISVTSSREEDMDYSQPIYDSGLAIMTTNEKGNASYVDIILESGILWFIFYAFLILLVVAHILWFFERGTSPRRHDYFRDDYFGGVWDSFWWAFIIMTMGGFENEVPHKIVSRLLAMFWIVVSLFFISTLTAKITTSLTVSELASSISSYQDLPGKKIGVLEAPTVQAFLAKNNIGYVEYKKIEDLYDDLGNGSLDAIVHDAPILEYYANTKGAGEFVIAGETFAPEKYSLIFPEGSSLKEEVDREIIRMKEDGRYDRIREKYFGTK